MLRGAMLVLLATACASKQGSATPTHANEEHRSPGPAPGKSPTERERALAALRADVDMICDAAKITGGTDFASVGPYIAEHMKTDLLADLFANIRTTTTLEMIVERVRTAMAVTRVESCATIEVLLANRPAP